MSWFDKSVTLKLIASPQDLARKSVAEKILRLLVATQDFTPEKYGEDEPLKEVFDPNDLDAAVDLWTLNSAPLHTLMFSGSCPFNFLLMVYLVPARRLSSWITLSVQEDYFLEKEHCSCFLNLSMRLFDAIAPDYSCIYHRPDYTRKNILESYFEDGTIESQQALGTDLAEGLPGVYWANFFGGVYVDFFSEERLQSAPSFLTRKLAEGYLLLTSASPLDFNTPEATATVKNITAHLNRNAFFDIAKPEHICTIPRELLSFT